MHLEADAVASATRTERHTNCQNGKKPSPKKGWENDRQALLQNLRRLYPANQRWEIRALLQVQEGEAMTYSTCAICDLEMPDDCIPNWMQFKNGRMVCMNCQLAVIEKNMEARPWTNRYASIQDMNWYWQSPKGLPSCQEWKGNSLNIRYVVKN